MSTMLSYPLINPTLAMLYQALLYWDGVATIVPDQYRDHLSQEMRRVDSEGLYHPISAESILRRPAVADEVLNQMLELESRLELDNGTSPDVPWVRIARGKLPTELVDDIVALGLGGYDSRSGSIVMEGYAASAMLSIVAREAANRRFVSMGHLGPGGLTPQTDQPWAFRVAHLPGSGMVDRRWIPCLQLEVGNVLPVPTVETEIGSILEFRRRYEDERRRMMLELDRFVHDLSNVYTHPEDIRSVVTRELEEAQADYLKAAKASGIGFLRRSLWAIVGAAAGFQSARSPHWQWLGSVATGIAINMATTPVRESTRGSFDRTYLHRIFREPVGARKPQRGR